jgi:hypothetical protein
MLEVASLSCLFQLSILFIEKLINKIENGSAYHFYSCIFISSLPAQISKFKFFHDLGEDTQDMIPV